MKTRKVRELNNNSNSHHYARTESWHMRKLMKLSSIVHTVVADLIFDLGSGGIGFLDVDRRACFCRQPRP